MKIVRDGLEIEMTPEELYAAYLEQQHSFDVGDVVKELQSVADEPDTYDASEVQAAEKLLQDRKALDEIADAKRARMTRYGTPWLTAVGDAVHEAIDRIAQSNIS